MASDEALEKAKKRVDAKIGFYIHLLVFVCVNVLLIAINVVTFKPDQTHYWFYWPLFGWGVGIVFHALAVFCFMNGTSIKDRMLEKEMKQEGREEE